VRSPPPRPARLGALAGRELRAHSSQYLRAMDRLHPHRQQLEDQLFGRSPTGSACPCARSSTSSPRPPSRATAPASWLNTATPAATTGAPARDQASRDPGGPAHHPSRLPWLRRAVSELHRLREQARRERLSERGIAEGATKILAQHKCACLFTPGQHQPAPLPHRPGPVPPAAAPPGSSSRRPTTLR
jgi:hypothetical protein